MILMDADIPYTRQCFERVIKELLEQSHEMVIGSRSHHETKNLIKVSPIRNFGSWTFNSMVQFIFPKIHFDTQCGLKAFKTERAKPLFSQSITNGFAIDVELILLSYINYKAKTIIKLLRRAL